jgi:hypothetical protein
MKTKMINDNGKQKNENNNAKNNWKRKQKRFCLLSIVFEDFHI